MPATVTHTLKKEERICSRKLIEKLFCGNGSQSMVAFPLRVVYLLQEQDVNNNTAQACVQMMVSVSKRRFKRAVDRNRVKRQVREAYRKQKQVVWNNMPENKHLAISFIWLDNKLHESNEVESKIGNLLRRISERL